MLPLWKSQSRYRIAKGGRGSGKSYGIGERFVTYALKEKCKLLCTRDVQNTLSDSALAILKRVIKDNGLDAAFEQTKHGLRCKNGSEFIFRGLQNPDRIKSLESLKRHHICLNPLLPVDLGILHGRSLGIPVGIQ